jgi:lipoprotein-releasing system permease protein
MIEGITARLLEVGTYHLQLSLPPGTPPSRLAEIARAIAVDREVTAAIPERQGTALLSTSRGAVGVMLRCIPSDAFGRDSGFRQLVSVRSGSADFSRRNSLLLGKAVADILGANPGDSVNLLTTWGAEMSGPPRLSPFTVAGIYETGYQELDKVLAFASLDAATLVLSTRASRAFIGVKVGEPFGDLSRVAARLSRSIRETSRISTWRELEYARLASFRTTKALLLFIMALIVLVASVNVSSASIMTLLERRYDLALLKSVGVGPRPLSLAFLAAGFATGLVGTAAGLAFGLLIAVNINEVIGGVQWAANACLAAVSALRSLLQPSVQAVGPLTLFNSSYYLKYIPVRINAAEIVIAGISTIFLATLVSYLPAVRASRTSPLEVLRRV